MPYCFLNKVSLITGGASGIGLSCGKELLRNGVKAITIADNNESNGKSAVNEITREFGSNKVIFVKADVSKKDQLESVFQQNLHKWGTIDIIVNNAGIMNDGQWELELSLNCVSKGAVVQSTFLGMKHMGKDNGGKGGIVVNISSLLGLRPLAFLPVYTGTKHFVVGFSRAFGTPYHYNRTGVKIITLCPGITNTPLLKEAVRVPLIVAPEVGHDLKQFMENKPLQSVDHVARALITIITKGENGSVWVVDNSKPVYNAELLDHEK